MKKICLIIPDSPFLLDARVFPFIGILKVASAYQQQGAIVDVVDLSGVTNWKDVVDKYFQENSDFEFIGLTATTPQMPMTFDIATYIKSKNDQFKMVIGGTHVTLMHTAMKLEQKNLVVNGRSRQNIEKIKEVFDVLVCGDGELLLPLVRQTDKGIIDADDRKSEFFLSDKQFSELPPPARHLIDLETYQYTIEGHKATSLIGQLGCPYRCSFCSGRNSPSLRVIRNRDPESIVKEIEFLHKKYDFTGFMFYDDELNLNKSMIDLMHKLTDLQMKLGKEFRLRGFIKSELFDEIQAKAMYDAGFRWLLCGFESGDDRILKNIEKQATKAENSRALEIGKKFNLKTKALMSVGHAGESEETVENTKKWLLENKPDDFDCTVITTYPGSPYYDSAKQSEEDPSVYVYTQPKTGDLLFQKSLDYTKECDYYKGIPGNYISYVWTDKIDAKTLVDARDALERDVRRELNIPFNPTGVAKQYEHSMGQGNVLPDWLLRSSMKFKDESVEIVEKVAKKRLLEVVK
jgi:radical SAM superfamily enzyme YgiQ (UPF0313 family)